MEDELKSIRSRFTNTASMISRKYRKRSTARGERVEMPQGKFSVLFVGQWEKQNSWKYVDMWFLVKYGIPPDLRVGLWKDLLRRQINEQITYKYFRKERDFAREYNDNLSVYANVKAFASKRDSVFYQQVEQDIKGFTFPEAYMKN